MGPSSEGSFHQSARRAHEAHHPSCPLPSSSSHKSLCRCFFTQTWSSSTPVHQWSIETHLLCIMVDVWNREKICPNREWSSRNNMGMLEICHIPDWQTLPCRDWPQTPSPLPGVKHLDTLPPRVIRFCLCLNRFHYNIKHVPSKELYTADALSRAPTPP